MDRSMPLIVIELDRAMFIAEVDKRKTSPIKNIMTYAVGTVTVCNEPRTPLIQTADEIFFVLNQRTIKSEFYTAKEKEVIEIYAGDVLNDDINGEKITILDVDEETWIKTLNDSGEIRKICRPRSLIRFSEVKKIMTQYSKRFSDEKKKFIKDIKRKMLYDLI